MTSINRVNDQGLRPAAQSPNASTEARGATSRLDALRGVGGLNRQQTMVSGSDLVARSLRSLGIEWIAGITGTPVHGIYRACAREGLRILGTRSQAGATLMTAASAFVAGRQSGAVVLSAGPAVTNAITGILVARDNHWPLLVLGGRRSLADAGRGQFQEIDSANLIRPIAKWSACAREVADIPDLLQKALCIAQSGQPGPVYLDLPEDILEAFTPSPACIEPFPAAWSAPAIDQLERVVTEIRKARKPVLVLGDGARWRLDPGRMRPWLEHLSLAMVPLPMMRGVVADTHPRVSADADSRARTLAEADLVLLVGVDLDWRLRFGAEINPRAAVIQIRESSAPTLNWESRIEMIQAEPGLFLNELQQRLAEAPRLPLAPTDGDESANHTSPQPIDTAPDQDRLSMQDVFEVVRATLPQEAFVVLDGKMTLEAGQSHIPRLHPFLYLDPGWNGCMGSGIPFAMAARLHHPSRPVLLVTGDFAFGLGAIELETAVRHALPLVVLVINNDGPSGALHQTNLLPLGHPERVHAFQPALCYDKLATSLGMASTCAATAVELSSALNASLTQSRALLINALVTPTSSRCGHP